MSDEVVWYQPVYGATYYPGQQIPVSWKSSQSSCHSSYRLCTSNALSAPQGRSEDGSASKCGTATWPKVNKQKNGTCTALLDAPPVQEEHTYILQMSDDSGVASESPYFTLTPSNKPMSAPDNTGKESYDNTPARPMEVMHTSPNNTASLSAQDAQRDRDQYFLQAPSTDDDLSLPSPPHAGAPSHLSARDAASDSSSSPSAPSMLLSTSAPNPISFAVPLGLVLLITLVAVGLAVRHYRKRVRERASDAEKLAGRGRLSRFSSMDSMYKAPLEYPVNAALPAHVSGPVPLFMPVDLDAQSPPPESRRAAPRKTVPVSASYTNVTAPSQGQGQGQGQGHAKTVRGSRPLMGTDMRGTIDGGQGVHLDVRPDTQEEARGR